MSGRLFDRYGAILAEDVQVLESVLTKLCAPGATVRVCEIGCHDGGTALGIMNFVKAHGADIQYWGIDPDSQRRHFYNPEFGWGTSERHVIYGDSAEVFNQVPGELDLVWVDGCHCKNHVVLDTLNFETKVRDHGFICFHDVNPTIQGHEKQYHGPDIPQFHVDVNAALHSIRFPWAPWKFFAEGIPLDAPGCGTRAYRKILP